MMGCVLDVSRVLNEYKTRTCGKTPKDIRAHVIKNEAVILDMFDLFSRSLTGLEGVWIAILSVIKFITKPSIFERKKN